MSIALDAGAKDQEDEVRLQAADHALAAELAEDKQELIDAMHAYLGDLQQLAEVVSARAKTEGGDADAPVDAAIGELRRNAFRVAEYLSEVRHSSGDRWSQRRGSLAALPVADQRS